MHFSGSSYCLHAIEEGSATSRVTVDASALEEFEVVSRVTSSSQAYADHLNPSPSSHYIRQQKQT